MYSNVHNFLSTWDSNINLYLSLIEYFSCKRKPRIHFELHWAVKMVKVEGKRSVKCIGWKNQMNAFSCSIHCGIIYFIFKKTFEGFYSPENCCIIFQLKNLWWLFFCYWRTLVNFVIALVNKLFASNYVLGPYPVLGPIPDSGDQVVEWISYNVEHGFQCICLNCHRYLTTFQSQRWVILSPIHHMWFPLIFLLNPFMSSLN